MNRKVHNGRTKSFATRVTTHLMSRCLWLFLFLWFASGTAINTANLYAFNLQQAGVEALVERKKISIDGSTSPHMQFKAYYYQGLPFGDVFERNERLYAAKQPGQFMFGAVVYSFLKFLGLSYINDYLLVSALVTFFTTSFATALAAIAVFGAARELSDHDSLLLPLSCSIAYALGSPAFVYSGIAHHDQLAAAYLMIGFYFLLLLKRQRVSTTQEKFLAVSAGLLLGLTLTTSILPVLMVLVLAIYVMGLLRWRMVALVAVGAIAGVTPMLIYNTAAFSNPLLLPNIAGGYRDTFLLPNPGLWGAHASFYVWSLMLYVPILPVALLGLIFFPREYRREQFLLCVLVAAQLFHVLNIESDGGCQFGPRYLLPVLPFGLLGLIGFRYVSNSIARLLVLAGAALTAGVSLFINFVGSVNGAMYCEKGQYALWPYLNNLARGEWKAMPLSKWLILPLVISLAMLILTVGVSARRSVTQLDPLQK